MFANHSSFFDINKILQLNLSYKFLDTSSAAVSCFKLLKCKSNTPLDCLGNEGTKAHIFVSTLLIFQVVRVRVRVRVRVIKHCEQYITSVACVKQNLAHLNSL